MIADIEPYRKIRQEILEKCFDNLYSAMFRREIVKLQAEIGINPPKEEDFPELRPGQDCNFTDTFPVLDVCRATPDGSPIGNLSARTVTDHPGILGSTFSELSSFLSSPPDFSGLVDYSKIDALSGLLSLPESPLSNMKEYYSHSSRFDSPDDPDSFRKFDTFMAEMRTIGHDNPLSAFNEFEAPLPPASPPPARRVLFDSEETGRMAGHDAFGTGGGGSPFGGPSHDRHEQDRYFRSLAREEAEAMIVDLANSRYPGEFQPVIV